MKKKKYNFEAAPVLRPGIVQTPAGQIYAVAAAPTSVVELLLYEPGAQRPFQTIPIPEEGRIGGLFSVLVEMPETDCPEYCFRVDGREVVDPCASKVVRVSGRAGKKMIRGLTADLVRTGEKPLGIPWTETVFYKLHVRGFTMGAGSGAKKKGTFRGLAEKLNYIRDLGATSVILMPCHELAESEEKNYWGYAEGYYFAPRGKYSATGDPVQEFADLVRAMHAAGLECITEFCFSPQMPSDKVLDILRHWSLVYGVDGFHLLGNGDWIAAAQQDAVLADRKLLCEHRPAPTYGNVAVYDRQYLYAMRRLLRGDRDVSIGEAAEHLCKNAEGGVFRINYFADQDGFTMADMVAYEEKRNEANGQENLDGSDYNLTWNCGHEGPTRRRDIEELRFRQLRNAFALLAFSQGIPLIYAGDECLNSQGGNNNAWCQDNETGWVTWSRGRRATELREFLRAFLAIRRAHPALRQSAPLRRTDYLGKGFPDVSFHNRNAWVGEYAPARDGLGIYYFGPYAETEDESLYLACNFSERDAVLALPKCPGCVGFSVIADTSKKERAPDRHTEETAVPVQARSVKLLAAVKGCAKASEEKNSKGDT